MKQKEGKEGTKKNKMNVIPSIFMNFWNRNNLDQLDNTISHLLFNKLLPIWYNILTFVSDLIGRSCSNLFMRIWCIYIAFFKSNTMGCRIGKCIMWEFLEGTYYSTINLPYARHYNLQFVYFKPTLSKQIFFF